MNASPEISSGKVIFKKSWTVQMIQNITSLARKNMDCIYQSLRIDA